MWIRVLTLVAVSIFGAHVAQAHSKLSGSNPAMGSVIAELPPVITLTFANPMRLAVVTLTENETVVRLDVPRGPAATVFDIPADTALAPGLITLDWRGIGSDGHVQTGTVSFTLTEQ